MGFVTARPLGLHVRGLVGFVVRLRAAGEAGIACGAGGAAGVPLYTGVVYQCASDLYSSSRAKFASDGGCRVPISSSG